MNWWEILEIPYNSDLKTIKSAYAKLLKVTNPEDNPEGYQKLRQAYDIAVKLEKRRRKEKEEDFKVNPYINPNMNIENKEEDLKVNPYINPNINIESKEPQYNLENEIKKFEARLDQIYTDINLRVDLNNWTELLNWDIVWNVEANKIIEDRLFHFVSFHKYLPPEVWNLLEINYKWTEKINELIEKKGDKKVKEIIGIINSPYKPKFKFINEINEDNLEEYLSLRQKAYENLKDKRYIEAAKTINEANKLCSKDSELMALFADYYNLATNDTEEALRYYKLALELDKTNLRCALKIGILLNLNLKFHQAIPYLEEYLNGKDDKNENDVEIALLNLADAYYYDNNFISAKNTFIKLLNLGNKNEAENLEVNKYLKNIEAKLAGKWARTISYEKYKTRKQTKENEIKQRNSNKVKWKRKDCIAVMLVLMIVSSGIRFVLRVSYDNSEKNKTEINHSIMEKKFEEDSKDMLYAHANPATTKTPTNSDEIISIKKIKDLENAKYSSTCSIYIKDVVQLDAFAVVDKDEQLIFCRSEEIKSENLGDKIYSQAFAGTIDGEKIIFIDNKFSKEALDSNGGYTVCVNKYEFQLIDSVMLQKIMNDLDCNRKFYIKVANKM